VSPTLANFLFEAANFLVLAGALGWVLFKPVRAALAAERERHEQQQAVATEAQQEAESLLEQAREARDGLEQQLEQRRAEALAEAREQVAALEEAGRRERAARVQQLEQRLEAARRSQSTRLAESLGRIAAASVRDLLDALDGPSLDLALVRAACRELSTVPAQARGACVVESARPLDDASRRLLTEALGGPFDERVVRQLGAGVRVTTGAGQVDGSAVALARRAAQQVAGAVASGSESAPGAAEAS
jgi:F-type H+-transporting ATPase subunit b